jgi:hypothetical protein
MNKLKFYPKPRPLLAKPFEWIMRGSYHTHLWLNGNSDWYVLDTHELDDIIIDFYNNGMAKELAEEKTGAYK